MHDFFIQICVIITVATVLGYLLKLLRQPMIPAYIGAGLLIGPILGIINDPASIQTLSEVGIAFLLFLVGMELDLKKLKDVGKTAIIGGTINSIVLFGIGFIIANLFSFNNIEAAYIGLVIAFSSTMVIVKSLADKRELKTLHGRILIGILLLEDLLAIIALSVISNTSLTHSMLSLVGLGVLTLLCAKFIMPFLFKEAAKHNELLFLMSLSVCFVFSASALFLGLSVVVGAFLAGISLSGLPYKIEIASKIKPLKDFFSTIFFVTLGTQIIFQDIVTIAWASVALIGIVLLIKPLIIMGVLRLLKYKSKTAFLSAVSLAQVSEFSLVIAALGHSTGMIGQSVLSLTVLLAIFTITMSSYLLKFDVKLYKLFIRNRHEDKPKHDSKHEVLLCGYNRIGYNILKRLNVLNKSSLVVDYDPDVIKQLSAKGVPCVYGDVGDAEMLNHLDLQNVNMVISTVPDVTDNCLILQKVRHVSNKAIVVVTASQLDEALYLYHVGADYVILPHFLGGEHVANVIGDFENNKSNILHSRLKHIEELQTRKELGHEHPVHD